MAGGPIANRANTAFVKLVENTAFVKLLEDIAFVKMFEDTAFVKLIENTAFAKLIEDTAFVKLIEKLSTQTADLGCRLDTVEAADNLDPHGVWEPLTKTAVVLVTNSCQTELLATAAYCQTEPVVVFAKSAVIAIREFITTGFYGKALELLNKPDG